MDPDKDVIQNKIKNKKAPWLKAIEPVYKSGMQQTGRLEAAGRADCLRKISAPERRVRGWTAPWKSPSGRFPSLPWPAGHRRLVLQSPLPWSAAAGGVVMQLNKIAVVVAKQSRPEAGSHFSGVQLPAWYFKVVSQQNHPYFVQLQLYQLHAPPFVGFQDYTTSLSRLQAPLQPTPAR